MCIFKSDWYPVWNAVGIWEDNANRVFNHSHYEILLSPKRNRYKIKVGGYKPKSHIIYISVVLKFNELVNKQKSGSEYFDFKSDPTS